MDATNKSLHIEAIAVAASNNWPFFYALGYASGKDDQENGRKSEHSTSENDDYALGYHRGFSNKADQIPDEKYRDAAIQPRFHRIARGNRAGMTEIAIQEAR